MDGQEGDEGGHCPNPEDHCNGPAPGQQETREYMQLKNIVKMVSENT